ncbi:MAG: hypothetical protein NVSMB1_23340 [Polyangiales bacterium]
MIRFVGTTRFPIAPLSAAIIGFAIAGCSSDGNGAATPLNDAAGEVDATGTDPEVSFDVQDEIEVALTDGSCGGTVITANARKVNLMILVDKSGSMSQTPAGFSTTKWRALRTALGTALTKAAPRISMGLELFPFDATTPIAPACAGNCCAMPTGAAAINVPIEEGTTAAPKILAALDATSPGGATPTAVALQRVLDYYTSGAGMALEGDKYVVLATDGGPNCNATLTCDALHCTKNLDGTACGPAGTNCCDATMGGSKIDCLDDGLTTTQLNGLKAKGIKTFVIGIPGSENYAPFLDAFAEAGGAAKAVSPKYFAVTAKKDVAGLTEVLSLITGELITTCKLQLAAAPTDVKLLNVFIDGVIVSQTGPDGWEIDNSTTPPTVVLKGATCTSMQTKGAKVVAIKQGCPTLK